VKIASPGTPPKNWVSTTSPSVAPSHALPKGVSIALRLAATAFAVSFA
jgi:hypothetical protein